MSEHMQELTPRHRRDPAHLVDKLREVDKLTYGPGPARPGESRLALAAAEEIERLTAELARAITMADGEVLTMDAIFVIQRQDGTSFYRDDAMGILATDSEAQAIRFAYAREDEGAEVVRYERALSAQPTPDSAATDGALSQPAGVPEGGLEAFTDYFVKNYPGPNTIIYNPKWHAPRIFRAAQRAIQAAAPAASGGEVDHG